MNNKSKLDSEISQALQVLIHVTIFTCKKRINVIIFLLPSPSLAPFPHTSFVLTSFPHTHTQSSPCVLHFFQHIFIHFPSIISVSFHPPPPSTNHSPVKISQHTWTTLSLVAVRVIHFSPVLFLSLPVTLYLPPPSTRFCKISFFVGTWALILYFLEGSCCTWRGCDIYSFLFSGILYSHWCVCV